MKLASFLLSNRRSWGVVVEDEVINVASLNSSLPNSLDRAIVEWHAIQESLERALQSAESGSRIPLSKVQLVAPISRPEKILCIGRNYADHAVEQGAEVPTQPVVFNKLPSSLIGHRQPIRIPEIAKKVDYEGELVVVIGREGHQISQSDAMDFVFGYTCGNDITARDWQKGRPGGQWLLGKTPDTFGPLGPWIVTADEIADVNSLDLQTRLNDQLMQSGNTRQFLFPIDQLIAHLSQFFTLRPGDLLFTGTPEGVGIARNPPVLLKDGDQISVDIPEIGRLSNPVWGPQK